MICPDCEFEYEKLNRNGVCKKCAQRMADAKYRNKEYVKLKDLRGTKLYDTVINHRQPKTKVKEKDNIKRDERSLAKEIVENDIQDRIKRLNIKEDLIKVPFEFVLESFVRVFSKEIINTKKLIKNEYDVLITDRLHKLLHIEDFNEIAQVALEQKYIEEKREIIKKELNLYEPFREIIDELLNDEIFKTKLDLALEKYYDLKKLYENPVYVTDTLSMQDLDFTIKSRTGTVKRKLAERKPMYRYYASVPCNNLYGNPEKTLFEANGGIVAENEEVAKERLKDILKQFNNVFYNDKDIVIKKYE